MGPLQCPRHVNHWLNRRSLTWITSENVRSFNSTLTHSRSPVPTATGAACCAASCIVSEIKADSRVRYHSLWQDTWKQSRSSTCTEQASGGEGKLEVRHRPIISKLHVSRPHPRGYKITFGCGCTSLTRDGTWLCVFCFVFYHRAGGHKALVRRSGCQLWTAPPGFRSKLAWRQAGGMGKGLCRVIACCHRKGRNVEQAFNGTLP